MAEVEKTVHKFGLCYERKTIILWKGVENDKGCEDFQLVDKAFFAPFCPFGNAGESAMVTAVKCDNSV